MSILVLSAIYMTLPLRVLSKCLELGNAPAKQSSEQCIQEIGIRHRETT